MDNPIAMIWMNETDDGAIELVPALVVARPSFAEVHILVHDQEGEIEQQSVTSDDLRFATQDELDEFRAVFDALAVEHKDRQAWEEDEKDMQRIKNEWDAYDRDPPGS